MINMDFSGSRIFWCTPGSGDLVRPELGQASVFWAALEPAQGGAAHGCRVLPSQRRGYGQHVSVNANIDVMNKSFISGK